MNQQTDPVPLENAGEAVDLSPEQIQTVETAVIEALRRVYDPEIPVNIYDLGLIYKIEVSSGGFVSIDMTLTSPACPVAGSLPGQVEHEVRSVENVTGVRVDLVWDPPWEMDKMSDEAKLELGFL